MIPIPLPLWDDKSIATTVTEPFEIMVDELNKLQFQLDTAGDAADLDSVVINLFTDKKQILGDVPLSDLREIHNLSQGMTSNDTHSIFEIDLGSYHLGGEKCYGTLYNGDAQTQTVDLQIISDLGLRPLELVYRKYTSTVFAVESCVGLFFHGSALDESDETLNLKIGNMERNLKLKNFFINHACETREEAIDLTFFSFFQLRTAYDIQVTTSADLSSNYIVAVSASNLGSPSEVQAKKDRAVRVARRAIGHMPKRTLETNIVSGALPATARSIHSRVNK